MDLFARTILLYKGGEVTTSTIFKFLSTMRHNLLEKGRH